MPDTPGFSPDEEEEIRQKQEEFQNVVEQYIKHPGRVIGINPGNDPIAREAMIRLMEKHIEQAIGSQGGQALDADALQEIKAEVREQVNALFARNSTT